MSFVLCARCRRHVRTGDARCPVCQATVASTSRSPTAAAVTLGVGLAVAGCQPPPTTPAMVLYGPPPLNLERPPAPPSGDAGTPQSATTVPVHVTAPDPVPAPAYGPPPARPR